MSLIWNFLQVFADDPDDDVKEVEFSFLHPKLDGFWDWPKNNDDAQVSAQHVFFGPCQPCPPRPGKGFRFLEEDEAKNNIEP